VSLGRGIQSHGVLTSNDVLESTTQLDTDVILDDIDAEVVSIKEPVEEFTILYIWTTNSRFTELFLGHFVSNVGYRDQRMRLLVSFL
jgi:hypothetical protein